MLCFHVWLSLCPEKGAAEQVVISGILPILALSLRSRGPLTLLTARLVAELAKECKLFKQLLMFIWFFFFCSRKSVMCWNLTFLILWGHFLFLLSFSFQPWFVKVSVTQAWSRLFCLCWPVQTRNCSFMLHWPSHGCLMTAVSEGKPL